MRMKSIYVYVKLAESNCDFNVHKMLGIPRSSMWSHITDLEKSLKKKLINRKKQSLSFTAAGEEFIEHANKIYQAFEESLINTQIADDKIIEGDLLISMTTAVAHQFSMESLKNLCSEFPGLRLHITSSDAVTKDEENATDIFVRPFGDSEYFTKIWYTSYEHALFASEEYVKKMGLPKTPEDLLSHRLIGYGEHTFSYFEDINWHLRGAGYGLPKLKPVLTINSTKAIFDAAVNGLGICSVPVEASGHYGYKLIRILPKTQGPTIKIYFCIRKNATGRRLKNINIFKNHFEDYLEHLGVSIIHC